VICRHRCRCRIPSRHRPSRRHHHRRFPLSPVALVAAAHGAVAVTTAIVVAIVIVRRRRHPSRRRYHSRPAADEAEDAPTVAPPASVASAADVAEPPSLTRAGRRRAPPPARHVHGERLNREEGALQQVPDRRAGRVRGCSEERSGQCRRCRRDRRAGSLDGVAQGTRRRQRRGLQAHHFRLVGRGRAGLRHREHGVRAAAQMTVQDGATVVHGAYAYPFFLHQYRSRHPYLCRRRRQTPFEVSTDIPSYQCKMRILFTLLALRVSYYCFQRGEACNLYNAIACACGVVDDRQGST